VSSPGNDKRAFDSAANPARGKIHGPLRDPNPERVVLFWHASARVFRGGRAPICSPRLVRRHLWRSSSPHGEIELFERPPLLPPPAAAP
jgi:hypothetical protein